MGIQIINPGGGGGGGGGSGDVFFDAGLGGANKTIDWNSGNIQMLTLSAATCVITYLNWKPRCTLLLKQDANGGRLATQSGVKWFGATTPTLTATAFKIDRMDYVYNGLNPLGSFALNVSDPSGLTPDSVPGLKLWFEASEGVVMDGSNKVSQWNDQSPMGTHATQSTGIYQPLYVANQLNSKGVLRFDGSDDLMLVNTADLYSAASGFTLYVGAKIAGGASYGDFIRAKPGARIMRWGADLTYGYLNMSLSGASQTPKSGAVTWGAGFNKVRYMYSGAGISSMANYSFQVNGANHGATDMGANYASSYSPSEIGTLMNGDMAFLLWYNAPLTTEQDAIVQAYLAEQWGI